jgi:hypothetical protein
MQPVFENPTKPQSIDQMLYHFSLYAWESQAPFDSTDCFVVEA